MKKKIEETNETRIILDKIANLTLITSNYLYLEFKNCSNESLASHIAFVDQIMNMCTDYATQLIPETDTKYSVSMNRIRAAFTLLSDYLTIHLLTKELEKQVTSIINVCLDYLEQIEFCSYGKGGGRHQSQIITKEYIAIPQVHKDSHLHEVYGLFYFSEHKLCINTNATTNIILWIDSNFNYHCIRCCE